MSDLLNGFTHFDAGWSAVETAVHDNSKAKGFYEKAFSFGEKIALIHSELSEALEADRMGNPDSQKINSSLIEEELADAVIRIMDLAAYLEIDLSGAIIAKHLYNKGRAYKHGKKY